MIVTHKRAIEILNTNEIVALPTETVYGLAANALSKEAVKKIFEAKNRPAKNPLIVHCGSTEEAKTFCEAFSEIELKLADAFWPGPLTIIKTANGNIPSITRAGLETVALRVPSHPLMQELLKALPFPLAAPSANPSGKPSATKAKHVESLFKGAIPVLDGGDCELGLESTVVKVDNGEVHVLRQGSLNVEKLEHVLGKIVSVEKGAKESPGSQFKHYSPEAKVILCTSETLPKLLEGSFQSKLGILGRDAFCKVAEKTSPQATLHKTGSTLESYSKELYNGLLSLDEKVELIFAEAVPHKNLGASIMDRLERASDQ